MGAVECSRPQGKHLTIMLLKISTFVVLISATVNGQVDRIKNDFKQCVSSGQDLNGCLRSLADAIKPYMTTGIPELGIPRADPLFIDEIAFDLKNPIIDVHVEFTDNQITGLSNHQLLDISADKEARTIEMKMFIPASKSVGKYVMEGKVAVLQLDRYAPADYETDFTNTTVSGKAQLNIVNNRVVIEQDPEITIDVGGLNIKMDNLFNGQADQLAKTVDKFLNQNTDKFIKDFQPAIAKSVSGFLRGFYNSAVSQIDVSVFQ